MENSVYFTFLGSVMLQDIIKPVDLAFPNVPLHILNSDRC